MTFYRVVDTNVAVAANGRITHADAKCQLACIVALKALIERGIVVIDSSGLILAEYRGRLQSSGQPGTGDALYKYLIDNQYDSGRCKIVDITLDELTGEIDHFPKDPALAGFDNDDKKFVAAAIASGVACPVINAVDNGWSDYEKPLADNGVVVKQLCPHHM